MYIYICIYACKYIGLASTILSTLDLVVANARPILSATASHRAWLAVVARPGGVVLSAWEEAYRLAQSLAKRWWGAPYAKAGVHVPLKCLRPAGWPLCGLSVGATSWPPRSAGTWSLKVAQATCMCPSSNQPTHQYTYLEYLCLYT